jgi:adenylate kinase family enzyme
MVRQTYAVRLDKDTHDYLKSKGDISNIIDKSLKDSGYFPSVSNIVAEIKSKRSEIVSLKLMLKRRIDIEVNEKFMDEVRERYNEYKKSTKYPVSFTDFYNKYKKVNSDKITSKIKEENEKYEQV